jgi:7,8-dihydropterin-6-yl-methyl-4-(beta-D-ribofuranosyl)aminobenzene 5'-phosphate synthase
MRVLIWCKRIAVAIILGGILHMSQHLAAKSAKDAVEYDGVRLCVVFNNVPYKADLETGWGFSCWIKDQDNTILFDTGGNGDILLRNMKRLGLDVKTVQAVVLSHIHGDHTGGLGRLLESNPNVTVYMPESFLAAFKQHVRRLGASSENVSGPRQLIGRVHSTGEMGLGVKEQALIVDTPRGLIVLTGCAHPNVAEMAERATAYLGKNIYLLMGGFHLDGRTDAEVQAIIARLKALGVRKVAPSHCTGDHATRMFRREWGDDFIEGGLGAVIDVP